MKSHNPCPISLQAVSDVKNNFFFLNFTLKSYQILLSCFLLFRIYFYLLLNIIMKI